MAKKYPIMYQREDGWTDWIYPNLDKYSMACCDCGLIHDIKFAPDLFVRGRIKAWILKKVLNLLGVNERVKMKARRNNRSTGQLRRYNYFICSKHHNNESNNCGR